MIKQHIIGGHGCVQIASGNNITINGRAVGGSDSIVGNGVIATECRKVSGFSDIVLNGPISFLFSVVEDEAPAIAIEADENILPFVKAEVENEVLNVWFDGCLSTNNPIKVAATMPRSITSCRSNGSGRSELRGINSVTLRLNLNGSGKIISKGRVDSLYAELNGSGDIKAQKLSARDAIVSLNGSGDIHVCAHSSISASLSGSGDIEVDGNPMKRETRIIGSGDINWND